MQATYEPDCMTAQTILDALDRTFPELSATEEPDAPMNGADAVDVLYEWRGLLVDSARQHAEEPGATRQARRDTQRGSIHLTLLAYQLAVALAIGAGVLSIIERAQAALGGVL